MTTEIISDSYENGKRISTQRVTYDKSDDLFALANYQRQYENVCTQLSAAPVGSDITFLQAEKTRLEGELVLQQAVVDGYTATT